MTVNISMNGRDCSVNTISGGQKDRISLAFFMAMYSGKIIMIDEILSSLDADTTEIVMKGLRKLSDCDCMVLFVGHQCVNGLFDGVLEV